MFSRSLAVGVFCTVLFSPLAEADPNEGFPGRPKYPDVKVLSKEQLYKDFDKFVIIDARSSLEFDTLRIKGSVNIAVAKKDPFIEKVVALRKETQKPIAFYCNGRTCMKSYIASQLAQRAGVKNVYAYDAGVFEFAQAYPEQAELLGKSPINPKDIIPKSAFKKRLLKPEEFSQRAYDMGDASLILDVRDKFQRGATGFFANKERWASLDDQKKLKAYLRQAAAEKKTLFIYDEVGKQVRWLQYTLEEEKIHDYYFMNHGAKAYWDTLMKF
jgi:rhodanese-related sulfurtransferase